MVDEDSSSIKLSGFSFLAQCVSQLPKIGRHVLVTGDTIARPDVVSSEETFSEGGVWMLWIDGRDPFLFSSILICFIFWRYTAGRAKVN